MRFVFCLFLTGSITAARAEAQLTWISQLEKGIAAISYQAPNTDNLWFWITCKVSDGTGSVGFEWKLEGINDGQRINFAISGPGGTKSYVGVAQGLEMGDGMRVNVELPSTLDALVPLSKPGTLTIRYPRNSFSMPLGPKAAQAINVFRSQCPPPKPASKPN
jgi:hypothetical protein